jgi:hypothetical protein
MASLKLIYYIFNPNLKKNWYATYYRFNEVHNDFIMILEEVLNLLSYII